MSIIGQSSLLNSSAGETMALAKPVMGTRVPRPRPLGDLVEQAQPGEQRRRQDQRHRDGGPRLLPLQPQALVPLQQPLPHGADPASHTEGPRQVLPQGRGCALPRTSASYS